MEENAEHGDYDREDIEHVENMLYANIHHDTGCNEAEHSSPNQSSATAMTVQDNATKSTEAERKSGTSRRNAKRYWNNESHNTPKFVPFFKEKHSGIYRPGKLVAGNANSSPAENAKNVKPTENCEISETSAPKQFTPYVSFLSFNETATNAIEEPIPSTSKDAPNSNATNTTNDALRKSLNTKHINPFSKKHTIDMYKSLYPDGSSEIGRIEPVENKKRLNPFNPLSRKAKKKKSESNQNKSVRKSREELKQVATKIETVASKATKSVADTSVIDLDADDKDDDDVIILPAQEPPLICVDSSDDETAPKVANEHEFTEPNAVSDSRRKVPRSSSPSSSIQSADDFIMQNDQNSFGFDTFGTLSDEDLCHVSEAVENDLRNKDTTSTSTKSKITNATDNAIFTPPKQMHKDKTAKSTAPIAKRSYEVSANSFTAVDVYESESSDMPDSIYAKGTARKRKTISDSDSSVESVSIVKSKRLKKRKSSLSAKESDHMHSDDSSSDLPTDDDDDDDDDETPMGSSYLVRGEALGKVKSSNNKRANKANKMSSSSEKRSEDDFMNKLSNIVYATNDSDDNEADQHETSAESIEAREIVESVLQRRTKKSKKSAEQSTNQEAESSNQADADKPSTSKKWAITDQVGETDEINLEILPETDEQSAQENDGRSENEKSQENEQRDSAEAASSKSNEANQSNEIDQQQKKQNQPIGQSDSNAEPEIPFNDEENESNTEIGWNDEMKRFYHESWGGESFSLRNIRARMPKGFLNWMIINNDKWPSNDYRGRQIRCLNCQDKGHRAKNCPQPPAKKRCYMCGVEGHLEPKCPNKMCLMCGRKTQKYSHGCGECSREKEMVCYICRCKGHRKILCPDRWRRYHSTVTTDQPLVREPKNVPQKPRNSLYCCICARQGHLAEDCFLANRFPAPLSNRVTSYGPLHNVSSDKYSTPKFTVLTSNLNDYDLNFGKEVSTTGNTIYARFRRAVNIEKHDLNRTSDSDVVIINESNPHETSDRPIEVYDDFDFEMDNLDNVTSSENFSSESTHDNSFMTIDNLDSDLNESEIDAHISNVSDADHEINQLCLKAQTLNELTNKIRAHKSNDDDDDEEDVDRDDTCQSTDQDLSKTNTDVDTSACEQKDTVSTSSVLPDFIPLSSDEPEKFEPTRSPSPVSADSTTTPNDKCDATIHLTKEHCKLLTEKGHKFLRDCEEKFKLSVRMEWRQFGNVLVVNGVANAQRDFHAELKQFFQWNEIDQKSWSVCNNLPKNRTSLIQFIRSQVTQLDSPFCNIKNAIDVQVLFHRIRHTEPNQSQKNVKKTNRLRSRLNMILFGRYGLADGQMHLDALQDQMRRLINQSQKNVPIERRKRLAEHIDYIFSSVDHGNYENVMDQYMLLKRDGRLPALNIDRKLMGLKINVLSNSPGNSPDSSSKNRSNSSVNQMESSSFSNQNTTPANTSTPNNKTNAVPSLLDIQINVSTPSTSYHNHEPNTSMDSMHRNNFSQPPRRRMSDKWKRI